MAASLRGTANLFSVSQVPVFTKPPARLLVAGRLSVAAGADALLKRLFLCRCRQKNGSNSSTHTGPFVAHSIGMSHDCAISVLQHVIAAVARVEPSLYCMCINILQAPPVLPPPTPPPTHRVTVKTSGGHLPVTCTEYVNTCQSPLFDHEKSTLRCCFLFVCAGGGSTPIMQTHTRCG